MGQISSNLLKKVFETSQLKDSMPLFPLAQPCTEIKILRYALHVSFIFFHLSFFSFSYLFAAVIDLPLGLLPVQKILRKHHQDGQFIPRSVHVKSQEILL